MRNAGDVSVSYQSLTKIHYYDDVPHLIRVRFDSLQFKTILEATIATWTASPDHFVPSFFHCTALANVQNVELISELIACNERNLNSVILISVMES